MKSQQTLKGALLAVAFLLLSAVSFAQTGKIAGTVSDLKTGETLIGVSVKIAGTTKGIGTDVEGKYVLAGIKAGKYVLEVSYLGFTTKKITDVEVKNGQTTTLNVSLSENSSQTLDGVTVKGTMSKETETAVLIGQKNAVEIKQGIGVQELARKGISDVEEGLTKITGITKVDGRGLFVRGLEDRYNNLLINSLAVPSNNPFKKIIPLDLFPTDIVSVLETYKTFNTGLYGDFAGGTFNIVTSKGEKSTTKVSIGTSMLSNTTFKKFLLSRDATSVGDYFGFSGSERDLPKVFAGTPVAKTMSADEALNGFGSGFDVNNESAPLNTSLNILHSNRILLSNQRSVNYLISANYDNSFQTREGADRFFSPVQGVYDNNLFTTKHRFATNSSLLAAIGYTSKRLNLNFNGFYLKGTENSIQNQLGYTNSQASVNNVFIRLDQLQNTGFFNGQLFATYKLTADEKHTLRAGGSYSLTKYELPDRKSFKGAIGNDGQLTLGYSGGGITRNYVDFDGSLYGSGLLEYRMKFGNDDLEKAHVLTIGYNGLTSNASSTNRFVISQNLSSSSVVVPVNQPDDIFASEISQGRFTYRDGSNSTYMAKLAENVNAGYLDLAFNIGEKFHFNAGSRFEQSQRETSYRASGSPTDPYLKVNRTSFDVLPAVNAKYELTKKANLRFSASKTLTKPVIMEAYPLEFQNPDLTTETGNQNLVNSKNYNVDIKYEFFPTNKEMISVTGFAKYLQNPIERLFQQTAGSGGLQIGYDNSKKALLYGAELELLLQLSKIHESLNAFSLGFNTSLMYTKVTIDKLKNTAETVANGDDNTRGLQGASPWLINADIKYENDFSKKWKSTMTLAYNIYGQRIYAVGTSGLDHYYEKPFGKLDFIWNNKIANKWDVKFGVENILNPTYQIKLGDKSTTTIFENDLTVKDYKRGVGFSLGLGYTF